MCISNIMDFKIDTISYRIEFRTVQKIICHGFLSDVITQSCGKFNSHVYKPMLNSEQESGIKLNRKLWYKITCL